MGLENFQLCAIGHSLKGEGINHSNTRLENTQDMYINGNFMLLDDTFPDRGASDSHTLIPESDNIRI